MDMKVLHDRVLLRKIEPENTTASGLVITSVTDPIFEATVVAVGTGKPVKDGQPIPLTVQVNDRVIYDPRSVITVNVGGENLLVIKEENIFAVYGQEEAN